MLKEERQQVMLTALKRDGKVVAADVSSLLGVSEDTVRRDLNELADAGLLRRVHGGAVPKAVTEVAYTARREQLIDAKASIAHAAAVLAQDGQVIFLDCGTTTTQVAACFSSHLRATVITNNVAALPILADFPYLEVIALGGSLHKPTLAIVGAEAAATLATLRADICFLGVNGLHPEAGISDFSYEEAHLKRLMIANATWVVALASADKLGRVAPFILGATATLTHLVTDATDDDTAVYRQMGIQVIHA